MPHTMGFWRSLSWLGLAGLDAEFLAGTIQGAPGKPSCNGRALPGPWVLTLSLQPCTSLRFSNICGWTQFGVGSARSYRELLHRLLGESKRTGLYSASTEMRDGSPAPHTGAPPKIRHLQIQPKAGWYGLNSGRLSFFTLSHLLPLRQVSLDTGPIFITPPLNAVQVSSPGSKAVTGVLS